MHYSEPLCPSHCQFISTPTGNQSQLSIICVDQSDVRTEDYDLGGEEYLTFTGTKSNLGGGMDAKSGVFTAPMAGAYMFTIHVCTHDMKKGLLSLRCNGNEVSIEPSLEESNQVI